MRHQLDRAPTSAEALGLGFVSGAAAAAVTNPIDVIAARMMVQDSRLRYGGSSLVAVARATLSEGTTAMWRGTLPRMAQLAPSSAVNLAVYEAARKWLLRSSGASSTSSSSNDDVMRPITAASVAGVGSSESTRVTESRSQRALRGAPTATDDDQSLTTQRVAPSGVEPLR